MVVFRSPISNSLVQSGVHSKQIVLQSTPSQTIPVIATLIRVNEASDWNSSTKHFEWSGMAEGSWEGKARTQLLKKKNKHTAVSKSTDWLEIWYS